MHGPAAGPGAPVRSGRAAAEYPSPAAPRGLLREVRGGPAAGTRASSVRAPAAGRHSERYWVMRIWLPNGSRTAMSRP